jgi:hypothetical protein
MASLRTISTRARSEAGITLIEVIVAAVLTIVIGYVILNVVFSAGQGLSDQTSLVSAHHELSGTLTGMENELRDAQMPLASWKSTPSELRFVIPGSTEKEPECIRYVVGPEEASGIYQLYQQRFTLTVTSAEEVNDPYGVNQCAEHNFNTPTGIGLLANLKTNANIFIPVDEGCSPETSNCPLSEDKTREENKEPICPTPLKTLNGSAIKAPLCPEAGVVINLAVNPDPEKTNGLSPIEEKTYVNLESAHANQ